MPLIHITADDAPEGETPEAYTDRLIRERKPGTFRQCAIGYHEECSDPDGEECTCPCHENKGN